MIAETAIELALKAEIDGAGLSWGIAWPNQDHPGTRPHIVVEFVRIGRRDDTLSGEMTISRGQMIATVVTDRGISSKLANQKADQIAALFPMGRRIAVTGGEIVIMKPADIREGFTQDAEWRTPVIVDFESN